MPSDKTGERRDIMVIIQIFKLEKDKTTTVVVFFKLNQKEKKMWGRGVGSGVADWFFRERTSDFSLKYRAIRPSKFF